MSIERSKYAKKQHSPAISAVSVDDNAAGNMGSNKPLSVTKPTTSIGGKWGALMAKPSAASVSCSPRIVEGTETTTAVIDGAHTHSTNHTSTTEMVRLGVREEDPKKRLAMSNRHAGGVYTSTMGVSSSLSLSLSRGTSSNYHHTTATEGVGVSVYFDDITPSVIDLKALPTKSILRVENSSTMGKSTSSSTVIDHPTAVNAPSKRVVWEDTIEGGQIQRVCLIEKAVYVNDELGDAPSVIQLPFLPDADGSIKVLWNDGDSQSP